MIALLFTMQSLNTIKTFNAVTFLEHSVDISYYISYTSWSRNPETDLPRCYSGINFEVFNQGIEAVNAHLTVIVDESSVFVDKERLDYGLNTISGIGIIDEYEDFGFYHPLRYYVTAKTETVFVYGHSESTWKTTFPRWLDEDIASFYITPNNPTVIEKESNIGGWPSWFSLCNWVALNIKYEHDIEVALNIKYEHDIDIHGVGEYWQLPIETLELRTGDCEDFSILLCSLYRANGYDENSVFVLVGPTNDLGKVVYGESWHAWVRINIGGIWTDIEPQDPTVVLGMFINFALFDGVYQFNDGSFTQLK